MASNKRFKVKCSTRGGVPRHVIVYARSKPKAESVVVNQEQGFYRGVGPRRITGVIVVEPAPELDLR